MSYAGAPSGNFDTPPRFISGHAPVYPITQVQAGHAGEATIDFTVDIEGHTTDFRVVSTTYPYFASHAILAIQKWKFEPGKKNGKPVPVRIRLPISYIMR